MLRVKFGEDGVTVTLDRSDGAGVEVTKPYKEVRVEFLHRKRFWCRLGDPLTAVRVAAHLNAIVWLLSEGTSDGGQDGNGV